LNYNIKNKTKLTIEQVISIIKSNKGGYLIIYSDWCPHSKVALKKLKDQEAIRIEVDEIDEDFDEIISKLVENKIIPSYHRTRPIIFYRNKFIGGNNELKVN
jgi:glutaredoxin